MKSISLEDLQKLRIQFEANTDNKVKQRIVENVGLSAATQDAEVVATTPPQSVFSLELETGDAHDQKTTGFCWLFASTTLSETYLIKKLKVPKFSLSKAFLVFYDKLEKVNSFYQHIIDTADLSLANKKVQAILRDAQGDGGYWHESVGLIEKYGFVPESVMPDTKLADFEDTRFLDSVINEKLRVDAKKLRETPAVKRTDLKSKMLGEMYRLLAICLGTPPENFVYEYEPEQDNNEKSGRKNIKRLETTPVAFAEKYGLDLDGFVDLFFDLDSRKNKRNKLYEQDLTDPIYGQNYLTATIAIDKSIKNAMIKQLEHGEAIYFGMDLTKQYSKQVDVLDANLLKYSELFGFDLTMSRDDRGLYRNGLGIESHACAIIGVHVVDGQPVRWKVKNSWGSKDSPNNAYYIVMNDDYLDKFVTHVVLRKRYLPLTIQKIFDQKPILVRYWD